MAQAATSATPTIPVPVEGSLLVPPGNSMEVQALDGTRQFNSLFDGTYVVPDESLLLPHPPVGQAISRTTTEDAVVDAKDEAPVGGFLPYTCGERRLHIHA
jgi:hypothetical protein